MTRQRIDPRDLNRAFQMVSELEPDSRLFSILLEGEWHVSLHLPGLYARWPVLDGRLHALFFDHTKLDAISAYETLDDAAEGTLVPLLWGGPAVDAGWGKLLYNESLGKTHKGDDALVQPSTSRCRTVLVDLEDAEPLAQYLNRCLRSVPDHGYGHVLEVAISGVDPSLPRTNLFNGSASAFLEVPSTELSEECLIDRIQDFVLSARSQRLQSLRRAARLGKAALVLRPLFVTYLRKTRYPATTILVSEIASRHLRNDTTLRRSWFVAPARSNRSVTFSSVRLKNDRRRVAVTGRRTDAELLDIAERLGKGFNHEILGVI